MVRIHCELPADEEQDLRETDPGSGGDLLVRPMTAAERAHYGYPALRRCEGCGRELPETRAHFRLNGGGLFSGYCHACYGKRKVVEDMMETAETRICRECGSEKPLTSEFWPVLNGKKLRPVCRDCYNAQQRQKREAARNSRPERDFAEVLASVDAGKQEPRAGGAVADQPGPEEFREDALPGGEIVHKETTAANPVEGLRLLRNLLEMAFHERIAVLEMDYRKQELRLDLNLGGQSWLLCLRCDGGADLPTGL